MSGKENQSREDQQRYLDPCGTGVRHMVTTIPLLSSSIFFIAWIFAAANCAFTLYPFVSFLLCQGRGPEGPCQQNGRVQQAILECN